MKKYISILLLLTIAFYGTAQKNNFSFEEELSVTTPMYVKAITFEGNISVEGIEKGNASLAVIVSKKGKLVELSKEEFKQHFRFTIVDKADSIEINTTIKEKENKKYWREEIEVSYLLKIPFETSINLYTMKGNIDTKGMLQHHKCVTSDGNIEVENAKGGLYLETSNGNIFIKNIEGPVFANTSNGKIQGNINLPKDSVICNSDNGTINIIIPGNTRANIFLKGKLINSSKINFDGTYERTIVAGRLNGGGIPVRMTATNGNVSLFYK